MEKEEGTIHGREPGAPRRPSASPSLSHSHRKPPSALLLPHQASTAPAPLRLFSSHLLARSDQTSSPYLRIDIRRFCLRPTLTATSSFSHSAIAPIRICSLFRLPLFGITIQHQLPHLAFSVVLSICGESPTPSTSPSVRPHLAEYIYLRLARLRQQRLLIQHLHASLSSLRSSPPSDIRSFCTTQAIASRRHGGTSKHRRCHLRCRQSSFRELPGGSYIKRILGHKIEAIAEISPCDARPCPVQCSPSGPFGSLDGRAKRTAITGACAIKAHTAP